MKIFQSGILWFFLLATSFSYGADWEIYSTDLDNNKDYYDASTVKYIDFGKAEAWIKEERGDVFGVSNIKADCNKDEYIYLQANTYNAKTKNLISMRTSSFETIKPSPDTVGYSLLSVVCEEALSREALQQANLPKMKDYSNDINHTISVFKSFGLDYENRTKKQTDEFNRGMADIKQKQVVYKSSLKLLKLIKKLKWMQENNI